MTLKVPVVVNSRLDVDVRQLPPDAVVKLVDLFTHENPQYSKLRAMGYAAKGEPKRIRTAITGPGWVTLPRGGTGRLRALLREYGAVPVWKDERTKPKPIAFPAHRRTLYDYQEVMADAAIDRENCIVRAQTGSGKTTVAMAVASRISVPTLVVVWNSALLDQWVERAQLELGLAKHEIGIIRAGKVELKPLTLAMQQTLAGRDEKEREPIAKYFGAVICDEVHRFAAKTFVDVIDWMPAKYRIGMSADHTRKDRKEFLIHDLFGEVATSVDEKVLVEKQFVMEVQVRVVPTGADYSWYRFSEGNFEFGNLLASMATDPARNALAADIAAAEVAAGHQVLVFSHRREHCALLVSALAARGIDAGIMLGGKDSEAELHRAIRGLKNGSMRAAVGTVQAIGTGIDLPSISRGVLATPIATNKQLWGQVRGRLCRTAEGKKDSVIYYLHDESAFGDYPVRNLRKWNSDVAVLRGNALQSVDDYLKDFIASSKNEMETLFVDTAAALSE